MAYDKGLGSCLIQQENGLPCGRQIAEGEAINTVVTPFGGPIVGHKKCADGYNLRKQQEKDMVKIGQQSGPGGPVEPSKFKDGIAQSIPLEQSRREVPEMPPMPQGVRPITEVPFDDNDLVEPPERNIYRDGNRPTAADVELRQRDFHGIQTSTSKLTSHEQHVLEAFRKGGSKAVQELELARTRRDQTKHTITIPMQDIPDETTVLEIRLVWPS